MLSGTTLGLELVNDIRQQTHSLAEYTNLIATETDQNSMKIKNALENFDILFNTFTELEKKMKTGFLEINKVSETFLVNVMDPLDIHLLVFNWII